MYAAVVELATQTPISPPYKPSTCVKERTWQRNHRTFQVIKPLQQLQTGSGYAKQKPTCMYYEEDMATSPQSPHKAIPGLRVRVRTRQLKSRKSHFIKTLHLLQGDSGLLNAENYTHVPTRVFGTDLAT